MPTSAEGVLAGLDLEALDAMTEAVGSGAGLPEIVRAAARALEASLVLVDRSGAILAVAARSPADEESLTTGASGVDTIQLRVAEQRIGVLRMRTRGEPGPVLIRLVTTLIALEVQRVRAPERASQEVAATFLRAVLSREMSGGDEILAAAETLGLDLNAGASFVVARVHAHVPSDEGWRPRVLAAAERGARASAPGALAALVDRADRGGTEITVLVPGEDDGQAGRAAEGILRELQSALPGHSFAVGRSRVADAPADLARAGNEALLAANIAEGDPERPLLAFDDTGAYRLLLPAMSEDPAELQRFYSETVEPLVAYDERLDSDLVRTVEAFLDADGNVASTAARLHAHRHTVRYRLERVMALSGLDVGSTDGREKLSLGLKAMRVLGISHRGGPASEAGSTGGRVPRRRD